MREIILREKGTLKVEGHCGRNGKPVVCVTDGMRFASAKEAAAYVGVHHTTISSCCLGKIKTAKGKVYKYVKEQTENCVDVLADTVQEQRRLFEKYAPLIAEMEAKEREEKARQMEEERKQEVIDKAKRKYARAEERFVKANQTRDKLMARYAKADKEFNAALDNLYVAKEELDRLEGGDELC